MTVPRSDTHLLCLRDESIAEQFSLAFVTGRLGTSAARLGISAEPGSRSDLKPGERVRFQPMIAQLPNGATLRSTSLAFVIPGERINNRIPIETPRVPRELPDGAPVSPQ
jgi:hypothetical protein